MLSTLRKQRDGHDGAPRHCRLSSPADPESAVFVQAELVYKPTLEWAQKYGVKLADTEKHREHELGVSAAGRMILATKGWYWSTLEGFRKLLNSLHNICWARAQDN